MNSDPEKNYEAINRQNWNARVETHVQSAFYDVPAFLNGKNSLNDVELKLLGDIKGKSILHLQCHFGQDSISLQRLGAMVTGVDLSDKAIDYARELALKTNTGAKFICCNLYHLPEHLTEQFDIVFTSYGTIGWLPDISKWAALIARYLKPGGKFVFADFHPVVWMFDNNFEKVTYNYFKDEAIVESESSTYADKEKNLELVSVGWNHGMAEVLGALLKEGLQIVTLEEFDYSPYKCFTNCVETEPGKFRIKEHGNKLPMVYAFSATKK